MIKQVFILFFILTLINGDEVELKLDQPADNKLPLIREKRQFGFGHGLMGHPFGMGHGGIYGHHGYPYGGGYHGHGYGYGHGYGHGHGHGHGGWGDDCFGCGGMGFRSSDDISGLHGGLNDGLMHPGFMNPLSMIGGMLGAGRSATQFQKQLIPPLTQEMPPTYFIPAHDAEHIYQEGYPLLSEQSGRAAPVPHYVFSSPYRYRVHNDHYDYDYPPQYDNPSCGH